MADRRDALAAAVTMHTQRTCKDVPEDSPRVAECAKEQARLTGEVQAYWADQDKFNANLMASIVAVKRLAELEYRLATTRTALQGIAMRGGRLDRDIEQWTTLDEQVRNEAQVAALGVIKSHLLLNLAEHVQNKVATAVRDDDRKSWIFPDFEGAALQRLRAEGLQRLAAARMDSGVSTALSGAEASQRTRNAEKWEDFLVNVGQSLVKDPLLARIVADAKAVPVIVYGIGVQYTVKQRLEEIRQLGDAQYEDAKRYATIYMQLLQEIKRLRSTLALTGSRCPVRLE